MNTCDITIYRFAEKGREGGKAARARKYDRKWLVKYKFGISKVWPH